MTLYLKYRPQTVSDLDLGSVRKVLIDTLSSKHIPHAFLFAGPKGTGKTSAARIVAKILNCEGRKKGSIEPCNKCDQCVSISKGTNIDVVELDAASNRGIDDIRSLKEAIKLSPARASKKVYIIDESHMLTLEASNALLKTLEEPPGHAFFILATTNPEKIIDTIKSRTTLVNFKKATVDEIISSLAKKAEGEKVKFKNEALRIIAQNSDGSFRDATKLLEQLISEGVKLEKKDVLGYFSKKGTEGADIFVKKFFEKDESYLLENIEERSNEGVDIYSFVESLVKYVHELILKDTIGGVKQDYATFDLVFLAESLIDVMQKTKTSTLPQLPLELLVVSWCRRSSGNDKDKTSDEPAKHKPPAEASREVTDGASKEFGSIHQDGLCGEGCVTKDGWRRIISEIGSVNTSIEALLRAARPIGLNEGVLTVGVYYKFHKERLEEIQKRKILEETVAKVLNQNLKVSCVLTQPPKAQIPVKEDVVLVETKDTLTDSGGDGIIDAAKKIFG